MSLASLARSSLNRAIGTLLPPICPACHEETGVERTLCPACWARMAFVQGPGCRTCGRPVPGGRAGEPDLVCEECVRFPPLWDRGAAVCRYQGTGRRLVLGLKHGDRLDTIPMLGHWMQCAGGPLLARADLIVPIPLHWRRLIKRRTNQSAELARWLARTTPARYAPRALVRTRLTNSQDGKDRAARIANLAGALATGPEGAWVAGKQVLLIDDVLTTGATLNAATSVLRDAGARGVDILVLALVVRDGYGYLGADHDDKDDDDGDS